VTSVVIGTRPAHGIAIANGLRVTYTPATDYFGADSFTYSAVGVTGNSSPATVSITIVGRPDPRQNATVTGMLAAQAASAERFAQTQIGNFQQRMESLHRRESVEVPARMAAAPTADVPSPDFLQRSYASAVQIPFAAEAVSLVTTGSVPVHARWANFWVSGNARFGRRGEGSASQGLEFSTSGLSLGADHRFSNQFAAGLGAGYARDRTDVGTDGSTSKAHGYSIAAYGSFQPTPRTFIDGVVGYGWLDLSSRRFVPLLGVFASADRDGHYGFASIAAGYEHRENGVLLSPYGRLDYASSILDAATETGGGVFSLNYGRSRSPISQGALGFRGETIRESDWGWVQPARACGISPPLQGRGLVDDRLRRHSGCRLPLYAHDHESQFPRVRIGHRSHLPRRPHGRARVAVPAGFRARERPGRAAHDLPGSRRTRLRLVAAGVPHGGDEAARPADGRGLHVRRQRLALAERRRETLRLFLLGQPALEQHLPPEPEHARDPQSRRWRGSVQALHGTFRATAGIEGELQYRTSGAFTAPTFALFAHANVDAYESRLRDGARYAAGASVRAALTDRVSAFGAYTHTRRTAENEVFEGRDDSLRLNLDYQWSRKSTLYVTADYRRGDFFGSGKEPELGNSLPHTHDFQNHALETADDAFPGYSAYRFDANTWITTLGWNWSIGPRESIDLSWRRVESKPRGSWGVETLYGTVIIGRYVTNQFFLVYLVSF
jgi:outer membrane autotransporter protein